MKRSDEYIYEVFKEKNFFKAAKKLFVSQPALSLMIKKSEKALGVQLFNRTTKPLSLTTAGEFYIEYIKKIKINEAELNQQLDLFRGQQKGTLAIGGAAFFCSYILPRLVNEFKLLYPAYTTLLTEGNPQYISNLLKKGDLELTVDVETLDPKIFTSLIWRQEHIVLAVPANNLLNKKLAKYSLTFKQMFNKEYLNSTYPAVSLQEFASEKFLFLNRGNDCYTRGLAMCKNAGFTPNIIMYLDQMLTSFNVARNGEGIAFIRADIMEYTEPTKKLLFYKIADVLATRNIYIYYQKDATLSAAAKRFVKFLQENK